MGEQVFLKSRSLRTSVFSLAPPPPASSNFFSRSDLSMVRMRKSSLYGNACYAGQTNALFVCLFVCLVNLVIVIVIALAGLVVICIIVGIIACWVQKRRKCRKDTRGE